MKEKERDLMNQEKGVKKTEIDPEWPQEAQDELQDFIESQGIYIRQ